MKKKALAFALVLCMVIAMLPVSVFAAQTQAAVKAAPVELDKLARELPGVSTQASYKVTLTGGSHGTTELLVSSPAAAGSEVYFLADPDDGYLSEVYVSGIDPSEVFYLGFDTWGFIMPSSRVTIEVKYVAAQGNSHRIKLYSGDGGQAELTRTSAKENESVYLAVLPDSQKSFDPEKHVFVTSGELYYLYMDEESGIHFYELFMPDEDVQVFVEYKKSGPFKVSAFPTSGEQSCTVKIEPAKAYFLDTVTVTITPAAGYKLTRVQAVSYAGDLVSDLTPIGSNKYTFTMHPADVDLYIDTERVASNVTVKAGPGGTASANVTQAKVGDTVTLTCVPNDNYRVDQITGVDGLRSQGNNTYAFTMPARDVSINVTFKTIYNPVKVNVETGLGGTASANLTQAKAGDIVTLTCLPEEGYRVAKITGISKLTDNGDNTYSFTMPDQAVTLNVLFLRHENPFLDVNETHFFYGPVLWAVEEGITSGITADTFGPFDACNRAQVVTFLWRYAGSPEPAATVNPFTDVPAESFYTKPVLWALENGITNGISATEFGPEVACNRAQVVTLLWRFMGEPTPELTAHSFTDVEAGSFYEMPVLWALEHGITTGATSDTFNPVGECLRAQVVTFLYRTKDLPVAHDLHWVINGFQDTPSDYGTVTLSHTSAVAGETITATVIPAEGYLIDWVKCELGTEITQVSDTEYTFVMPDHEEVFHVNFVETPAEPDPEPADPVKPGKTYELMLKDNGHGTVSLVDGSTAAPGESIFFYAIPEEGYALTNVGIFNPDNAIDVSKIQLNEHGDNLYELVMIDHDIIMTCYFTPIG